MLKDLKDIGWSPHPWLSCFVLPPICSAKFLELSESLLWVQAPAMGFGFPQIHRKYTLAWGGPWRRVKMESPPSLGLGTINMAPMWKE